METVGGRSDPTRYAIPRTDFAPTFRASSRQSIGWPGMLPPWPTTIQTTNTMTAAAVISGAGRAPLLCASHAQPKSPTITHQNMLMSSLG
jgi:hypothetical protein